MEKVSIQNELKTYILNKKNQKLVTVIHRPQSKGKFPAVILLHGFTGNKEEKHIKQLAADLANNNFISIRFDASGYGESEGSVEKDYRITNYLYDIEAVYNHIKSLQYIDSKHIGIFGHSMGAMLVVIFVAKHPEIKASVSAQPPFEMESQHRMKGMWRDWKEKGFFEKKENGKTIKIPWAFMEDAKKYNALEFVVKVKTPILFIFGKRDIDVLPEETRELYRKANDPKELFEVDIDHDYKNSPEILKVVNKKILNFYQRYL